MRLRPSWWRVAAAFALGFVALAGAPASGAAAPPPAGTGDGGVAAVGEEVWPLDPGFDIVELDGVAPSAEFELDIPPGWAPAGPGALVLDYSTPSLVESVAIGVTLNGDFVDAASLDIGAGTASIGLPADGFRVGTNTVRVDAAIGVLDDRECPDPWHPARVVTFAGTSRITLPLSITGPLLLDTLPGSLEPVGNDDRTVTVRMGQSPSDAELTAAAAIVAGLRSGTSLDIAVEVESLASARRATGPDVLIGVAADLDAVGIEVPDATGGILEIGRNPSGNTRLVVAGATPEDVLAAARSIEGAPSAPSQTGIEAAPALAPPVLPDRFTLADLGYSDRDLVGPGVASVVYGFDAPLSRAPTSVTVTVDAVRSASGAEVSGLSVFVNGSRVGTVHFDVDTGATSGVQLNVSGDVVRPGRNFLRVEAEFRGPSHDCDQRPPDESVEISASTNIEMITNDTTVAVDLEDLPYLLRAPEDSAQLVVVLPDAPGRQDLADAIDIAAVYGDEEFPARIAGAGTLDFDGLVGHHVIALGDPAAQPLHELLPTSIVATQFDPVDSPLATGDVSTRLNGVIEVLPNPADVTKVVMVATGFDAPGADLATRVLLDPKLRGELYGRATFVGGTADDAVLAPVLEPVRIERGERIVEPDDQNDEVTPAVADEADDDSDAAGSASADSPVFEVASSPRSAVFGPLPLGLAGLAAAGALAAGAWFVTRRRREQAAARP